MAASPVSGRRNRKTTAIPTVNRVSCYRLFTSLALSLSLTHSLTHSLSVCLSFSLPLAPLFATLTDPFRPTDATISLSLSIYLSNSASLSLSLSLSRSLSRFVSFSRYARCAFPRSRVVFPKVLEIGECTQYEAESGRAGGEGEEKKRPGE
jgi:hypothetical protein